ncbi:MAG: BREX-1 system adenine-specific DNA-methyltransferase PglX [Eubacteriales bacterium]|nr:BREX-1 system adenine-specific DNA-methyltransferase PglX [Eubacteriales bacterium]
MNKTAIKNFAVWARRKLISEITYKTGLLGITENGIAEVTEPAKGVQVISLGKAGQTELVGNEISQRSALVSAIKAKEKTSDYKTAFQSVIEEVAYTWFNRLIAVRFMEVNDYLPSRVRVLSSENPSKNEPDFVTAPFDTDLEFTPYERDRVLQLKDENKLDELFRLLFIKQCNKLHDILPELFEKTDDYTELLLTISFTDKDGVVYHLVHDIAEDDFNVGKEGQVEIIGWLYQYYNTEPKDEVFALLKKNVKITKERIPAATQLFTPDWIVRYMVENSLGRLWINHLESSFGYTYESNTPLRTENGERVVDVLKSNWKYYLDEAEQSEDVEFQLEKILETYRDLKPEDIKVIDPCMGSGHILVYAFDVLMQIYESYGYTQRDAAKSIIQNNLYGLDIDDRAYQLAYFAVMMKARQYNRRILSGEVRPNLYAIQDSSPITKEIIDFIANDDAKLRSAMQSIADDLTNAKEYGSIIDVAPVNFDAIYTRFEEIKNTFYENMFAQMNQNICNEVILPLVQQAQIMAQKYDTVITNPPYMGSSGMSGKLSDYVKTNYPDSKSDLFAVFIERCGQMTKKNRYQAMITQHAWMFLSSFEKLRSKMLGCDTINMAHLGARAFDEIGGEVVQTTSFVLRKSNMTEYNGTYARLVDYNSQQAKQEAFLAKNDMHTARKGNFSKIPGSPIAYWVSERFISIFDNYDIYSISVSASQNVTGNNAKYLRFFWEVENNKINKNIKWIFYAKGGGFRKWYGNMIDVIDWTPSSREIYRTGHASQIVPENYWYKKGITWGLITSNIPSFRLLPVDSTFDKGGSSIFITDDKKYNYILGLLNSKVFLNVVKIFNPTLNFQVKDIRSMPVILKSENEISELVKNNLILSKTDWDSFETSWDFEKHPFLKWLASARFYKDDEIQEHLIEDSFELWKIDTEYKFNKLKANEEELNHIFIDIYSLQDELTPEVEDKDVTVRKADLQRDIRSFISYAVGCMFGRYSLDAEGLAYAGGDWDSKKYTTYLPDADNCVPITDEEYFEDDIVGRFVQFVKTVYGAETLEENLDFIAKALSNKGNTSREIIRNYFLNDFYADHCKIYQKRPIYWLFDSGKQNGFKALVYMHRWNADTVGNVRVEYLHKMQRVYESETVRMQETIDNSTNAREVAAAEKRKEKLVKQLKETKDYDAKIAHIALSRINIDLDDGVKVNYEKVQTAQDGKKIDILAKI